jgi:hypothetical protein
MKNFEEIANKIQTAVSQILEQSGFEILQTRVAHDDNTFNVVIGSISVPTDIDNLVRPTTAELESGDIEVPCLAQIKRGGGAVDVIILSRKTKKYIYKLVGEVSKDKQSANFGNFFNIVK